MESDAGFCSNCGKAGDAKEVARVPGTFIEKPMMIKEMGELLAEASGGNRSAIIFYVAIGSIMAIGFLALGAGAGERMYFFGTPLTQEDLRILQIMYISCGIILGFWGLLEGAAISETFIKVYENGVSGKGLSKWFYLGDIRRFDFILTYDQISVDVNGGTINVHGPGTYYKVYVSNGSEIQQTIYQHKQKLARKSD